MSEVKRHSLAELTDHIESNPEEFGLSSEVLEKKDREPKPGDIDGQDIIDYQIVMKLVDEVLSKEEADKAAKVINLIADTKEGQTGQHVYLQIIGSMAPDLSEE